MKTVAAISIGVGNKLSASARKSLVRNLRALESHLKGEPLKLAYYAADGSRPYVYHYTIAAESTRYVNWTWDTTLSHEIERGNITSVPEPFIEAVTKTLENQKSKVDASKINAAKKALAGLNEIERKQLLDFIDKPRIVRKTLKSIDNAKTRVVKSRENDRKDKKPSPAEIRKASKTADEKVA